MASGFPRVLGFGETNPGTGKPSMQKGVHIAIWVYRLARYRYRYILFNNIKNDTWYCNIALPTRVCTRVRTRVYMAIVAATRVAAIVLQYWVGSMLFEYVYPYCNTGTGTGTGTYHAGTGL